ncbi:hypothetical protein HF521_001814 [Silurus meridionalis]|uniref:Ig-like domain-containing protein n=1 Tax=Silurus meridionalis TaxID=175797 RepID=A0A8T0BA90_SILME|nr:hypothetical protein HF521_001814 [Silurus meridionalis]
MILLSISIFWLSVCVDPISADPPITVEAHVGSTALLPCNLSEDFTQTPHIQWRADDKIVFERNINSIDDGKGYKGRVDVPEDELRKENCSLVLKDVRITDHAFYTSFVLEHVEATKTYKTTKINRVHLNVFQSVSAQVGSTAVLPCDWRHLSIQTPHVEWRIGDETVFKRLGKESFQGEGYEGRVDVPEEELLKGNCSLVLKNVRVTDEARYSSYMVVINYYKLVQRVKLSVSVFQSVSAQVGSTAVLPCDWRHLSIQTPHVEWSIGRETVFERKGKKSFQGERYEGRVDVPEEELLKGNCSLVLKNVSVTDEARYSSYMVVINTKKPVLVQNIKLSVRGTEMVEPMVEASATLPRFDTFSPSVSAATRDEACTKVRIARL